jgi:hypothetical protein
LCQTNLSGPAEKPGGRLVRRDEIPNRPPRGRILILHAKGSSAPRGGIPVQVGARKDSRTSRSKDSRTSSLQHPPPICPALVARLIFTDGNQLEFDGIRLLCEFNVRW